MTILPAELTTIITLWREEQEIRLLLTSLRKHDTIFKNILVIDNSENDLGSQIRHEYPEITVLTAPQNLGYAGGNNLGLDYALKTNTQAILILNSDTELPDDFAAHLCLDLATCPGVYGAASLDRHTRPSKIVYGIKINLTTGRIYESQNSAVVKDLIPGGWFLLITREVLEKLRGFDEKFFCYYEELDFCLKARASGFPVRTVPELHLIHGKISPDSTEKESYRFYYGMRNHLALIRNHGRNIPGPLKLIRTIFLIILAYLDAAIHSPGSVRTALQYTTCGLEDYFRGRMGRFSRHDEKTSKKPG
ncbi:glycosyltransferase family 2 protein [candidate division CSSED10-310 bacterium]|uniref:Glycosyltransferase family 2 protein n=1 Tax=candidate division CSSED10-310 bacterium TaxID=2855610 RepID=A0ABV6YWN1_UNCC1